jgi:tight adherence protein B
MLSIITALIAGSAIVVFFTGLSHRRSELDYLTEELGYARPYSSTQAEKVSFYERLQTELARAGLNLPVPTFVWAWVLTVGIMAALLFLIGKIGPFGVVASPILVTIIAYYLIKGMQSRRSAKIDRQLSHALVIISSLLSASGTSLESAIEEAARRVPAPLGPELRIVARLVRSGRDILDALVDVGKRVQSREWDFMTLSVRVQTSRGGDIVRMFGQLSETISQRIAMRGQAKSLLSEAQTSKHFLAVITPLMLLIMLVTDGSETKKLFGPDLWMLLVAGALWLGGILVTSAMTKSLEF